MKYIKRIIKLIKEFLNKIFNREEKIIIQGVVNTSFYKEANNCKYFLNLTNKNK